MFFTKRRLALGLALLVTTAAGVQSLGTREAEACGAFFQPATKRAPSLTYERSLIVFDADREREDFVREVVFQESRDPFGFVVPTPARPEVTPVVSSPFDALERSFPFERKGGGGARGGGGFERAKSASAGAPGVEVLSKEKIGSFTAFVLAASDQGALSGWLKKNGFVSSPASDAWLAHYVKLGFFYVAMRYDPPAVTSAATRAETIRIAFDAPLPFYPYREPPRPEEAKGHERMLDLWLVTTSRFIPVATHESEGRVRWVQPLARGITSVGPGIRDKVIRAMGGSPDLPSGKVEVRRFADQKQGREAFGDIVFVPESAVPATPERQKRLERFLSLVAPSLEGAP